jgi:predicted outer membrane protein
MPASPGTDPRPLAAALDRRLGLVACLALAACGQPTDRSRAEAARSDVRRAGSDLVEAADQAGAALGQDARIDRRRLKALTAKMDRDAARLGAETDRAAAKAKVDLEQGARRSEAAARRADP